MKNKTKWILGISLGTAAAAAAGTGFLLYRAFLPKVRNEKGFIEADQLAESAALPEPAKTLDQARQNDDTHIQKWPYALLLGCPNRDDGSLSSSQIKRCKLAIDAYNQGLYNKLIISGGAVKNRYVEAEQMADYIKSHTDQPIKILLETKARSTWENLKNTRLMIGNKPILIMTSSLHARRAAAMASHSFSHFSVLTYPDYKPRHILREIISRMIYIRMELKKLLTLA